MINKLEEHMKVYLVFFVCKNLIYLTTSIAKKSIIY